MLSTLLKKRGIKNITGYDAVVPVEDVKPHGIKVAKSIKEGASDAHAIVIMNNHEAFSNLNLGVVLKDAKESALFFDTWALYESTDVDSVPHVVHRRL
jgi:UDP-N-acetyl-D-mannosaminuronate dehydrogenase